MMKRVRTIDDSESESDDSVDARGVPSQSARRGIYQVVT